LSSTNAVVRFLPYQANAFGDVALLVTELMAQQLGTMRLINSRFARETNSFGMKEQTH
jgi:hypothetical protein